MIYKVSGVLSVITILTITAGARAATPGFVEDFKSDMTAHWHSQSQITAISTGGVGGVGDGYLEVANNSFDAKLGVHTTELEYTGDLIAGGVTGFTFWLKDVGADEDLEIHVGVGKANTNVWLSMDGFSPPEDQWSQFSVDITDPSAWVQIIGSGTFAEAVSDSNRLLFRHDKPSLVQNPDEITADFGIDRITIVPEPPSGLALLLGSLLIACRTLFRLPRSVRKTSLLHTRLRLAVIVLVACFVGEQKLLAQFDDVQFGDIPARLEPFATGLDIVVTENAAGSQQGFGPTDLVFIPDDSSGRLLAITYGGIGRILDSMGNLSAPPFLDLASSTSPTRNLKFEK